MAPGRRTKSSGDLRSYGGNRRRPHIAGSRNPSGEDRRDFEFTFDYAMTSPGDRTDGINELGVSVDPPASPQQAVASSFFGTG